MEFIKEVLPALSALAWPVVFLTLILMMRIPIKHLLMATRRLDVGGLELKFNELTEAIAETKAPERHKEVVGEKRSRLLKIPNVSFHYADKERIENFYNDYFREPTVENMIREIASESSGDLGAKLPQLLEAKAGAKDLTKWISTLKLPDTSLNGKFLRYQRETIRKDQVILDLELEEVELSALREFECLVSKLRSEFELMIDDDAIRHAEATLKEKSAELTLSKLESASGWVLIEGSFCISEGSQDFYKCTCIHPISSYTENSGQNVVLSFLAPKSGIEPHVAGNYLQSIGKEIPLRVYGEIWQPLNRRDQTWEVQITPLAVY